MGAVVEGELQLSEQRNETSKAGTAKGWRVSLKAALAALVALVLLPTLGVVALSLMQAGRSLQDAATNQLQETVQVVAQSVAIELDTTARMLANYAALRASAGGDLTANDGTLFQGQFAMVRVRKDARNSGARMSLPNGAPEELALTAARTGKPAISNLIDIDNDPSPRIAMAVPYRTEGDDVDVMTLVAKPQDLVHSLERQADALRLRAMAVNDAHGRGVASSRSASSIGKRVPDWDRLLAVGKPSGTFNARLMDGRTEGLFAFQTIGGTPGWVAIVAVPQEVIEGRGRQPFIVLLIASILTVLAALLLATGLAAWILRPIKRLVAHAQAVVAGPGAVPLVTAGVPHSFVSEFETLRESLENSEAELHRSLQAERGTAQSLAARELRYRTIAQVGTLAFWATAPDGQNPHSFGVEALEGFEDGTLRSDRWRDHTHPEDRIKADLLWQEALRQRKRFEAEFRVRGKAGWRWLRSTAAPVIGDKGELIEWIGVVRDITGRREAEEALRLERERLSLATALGRMGVWEINLETRENICDERWHEIFGLPPDQVITSELFRSMVHPDDIQHAIGRVAALKETEQDNVTFRIIRPDGAVRWLSSAACLTERRGDVSSRVIGIVMDITETRLAEKRLQESYEALQQAEKLALIGSWTLDIDTGVLTCSDMLWEINGRDRTQAATIAGLASTMNPEDFERLNAAIERCKATGAPYDLEVEHRRPNGTSFIANVRGQAIRGEGGKIIRLAGTVQDISERREAAARLSALADNLPKGAIYRMEWVPNESQYLTYMSAGIVKLIGITAEALIERGHGFWNEVDPADRPSVRNLLDRAYETRTMAECEFRSKGPSGEPVWMRIRSVPRFQRDGKVVWDGIIQDITNEKVAAEVLRQAKEAAEAAERTKGDFLATMSHEIRTPMNTVIGMTRLTLQTDLTGKQRNYLEKIDTSAKTLLGLINDVLDYSKIEAGGLELEDTVFDLDGLLESVSSVTAIRAEEKDLEIAYAIAPQTPRRLRGDPLRLTQILTNLISNAIKFTAAGEVVVSIAPEVESDGRPMLSFSVRDTGIGLTEDQIWGLFRPFSQAERSTSRKYGGTGLGLAICKQLVDMMGGHIEAQGMPGRGSTFTFAIPLRSADETIQAEAVARRAGGIENRRVLIVDDNASARHILRAMVQDFGMAVETVESGAEALSALHLAVARKQPFDIVLMDWRMPGMDGLETARQIRTDAGLPFMPAVLMVTAYGREEVLRRAEQLGLQGVLIKPITESVMYNTLLDILAPVSIPLFDGGAGAASRNLPLQSELLAQLAGKRVLVVDDNALNREVASDFLLAVAMDVATAIDGEDALRILALQPFDVVLMDMHMPVMDGLSATRAIRAEPKWAKLPIVALTAQARIEDRKVSLEAGMTAHLTKPIDEVQLYKTLAEVLGLTSVLAEAGAAQAAPAAQNGAVRRPSLDLAAILRRFGGNKERAERLLRGFLRDFHDTPQRLKHALGAADLQEVAALAHLVKGSTGYFEQDEICVAAEWLEDAARRGDMVASVAFADILNRHFRNLLEDVRHALPDSGGRNGASQPLDADAALQLIAQAAPLIADGDHAAHALLERIRNGLPNDQERWIAEEIRGYFDDLDLAAAGAALERLKATLQTNQGQME